MTATDAWADLVAGLSTPPKCESERDSCTDEARWWVKRNCPNNCMTLLCDLHFAEGRRRFEAFAKTGGRFATCFYCRKPFPVTGPERMYGPL